MSQYKGVWVLIERRDDELKDGALELVGEGRRIADKLKENLVALTPGNVSAEQARLLSQHGAQRILTAECPAPIRDSLEISCHVFSEIIKAHDPEIVLSVHTINGADLACRIAANLGAGLITACDRIDVNDENLLVAAKLIYSGKATATCVCPQARPQMATVNLDALELKRTKPGASAEVISLQIKGIPETIGTQTVDFLPGDPRAIDLTEAEIVVAGGRGLGSASNFKLIEELADLLRGSVGATRWAVDAKWLPHDRQIGLTGKTVSPRLYFGCGLSGASQHTMGMKNSKVIVAINKDKHAPIFEIADLGVVGDLFEVIPELVKQLREEEL
jgi:electron transfer flavoprotein alpha subunit